MFKKKDVQTLYSQLLKSIVSFMGNGITADDEIDQVGKALFSTKWNGVFTSDAKYPLKGYCVVNLDKSGQPGSHWVAIANGNVYDSFGRCGLLTRTGLTCAGDKSSDQKIKENNCGQRSLAWLLVYQICGLKGANKV